MPQILVIADSQTDTADAVVYRERISSADLESAHFSGQLVERVGWAVRDANLLERESVALSPSRTMAISPPRSRGVQAA